MAREQVEVAGKEQVLTSLGTATVAAAREAGRVAGVDPAVRRAAAAGDDAVARRAARVLAGARSRPGESARSRRFRISKRAIELDPDFRDGAGAAVGRLRQHRAAHEAPAFARRAFELRDRVSERERFFISWRYYVDAAQAWDKALELARVLDHDLSARSVCVQQPGHRLRRVRSARAGGRRVPRSDPSRRQVRAAARKPGRVVDRAQPVRRGESDACARRASAGSTSSASGGWPICSPFSTAIRPAMARELDRVRGTPEAMWASMLAGADVRLFRTISSRARAVPARRAGGACATTSASSRRSGPWKMPSRMRSPASAPTRGGRSGRARARVATISRSSARAARSALCGADEGSSLSGELAERFPERDAHDPNSAAGGCRRARAPARRTGARARAPGPGQAYDWAPASEFWPAYLRGQAYLSLKDGRGGQRAVPRHPGPSRRGADVAALPAGAARARPRGGARAEPSTRRARRMRRFCALWTGADAGLQPVERSARGVRPPSVVHFSFRPRCRRYTSARRTCFSRRLPGRRPSAAPLWPEPAATMPPCGRKSSRCSHSTTTTTTTRRKPARSPRDDVFAPGEVFAGRYRMIARIGRGGMGDVWRADDLVLETAGRVEADLVDRPRRPRAHPQRGPTRAADHPSRRVPGLRRRRGRGRHLLLDGAGSRARTSPRFCGASAGCRPRRSSTSAVSCAPVWRRRTPRACCIAISSRRTC